MISAFLVIRQKFVRFSPEELFEGLRAREINRFARSVMRDKTYTPIAPWRFTLRPGYQASLFQTVSSTGAHRMRDWHAIGLKPVIDEKVGCSEEEGEK